MIQKVDPKKLIVGEKYYVKDKSSIRVFSCIFRHNIVDNKIFWISIFIIKYSQVTELNCIHYEFYRYVSKEEEYAKLKEKYDKTCLNIVLKRLVDDLFVQ